MIVQEEQEQHQEGCAETVAQKWRHSMAPRQHCRLHFCVPHMHLVFKSNACSRIIIYHRFLSSYIHHHHLSSSPIHRHHHHHHHHVSRPKHRRVSGCNQSLKSLSSSDAVCRIPPFLIPSLPPSGGCRCSLGFGHELSNSTPA